MGSVDAAETACWQDDSGELRVVLSEVFPWLAGAELAACGAVCSAWRRVAADAGLWRRLLRDTVCDRTLRALREHCPTVSWRQEYVNACAGWELVARVPGGERGGERGAAWTHAAMDDAGCRLALAADDGTFSIWQQLNDFWQEEWSTDLRSRGWSGAVRSAWGAGSEAGGTRLLVTGALALADRWELLVLERDESGTYRSMARAGCSAGAGGCWAGAGGEGFLSLELCRLAPRLAVTVVWLNAATQETQSEFAGVTSPLLRIFNEDSAHLTHVLLADVPLEEFKPVSSDVADQDCYSLGDSYYVATADKSEESTEESVQTLVTASQGAGGALRSWVVSARRPPPLRAVNAGDLRARATRRRAARAGADYDEPDDPDEPTVRAMCNPPEAECYLHSAILGLVLHPNARCTWVSTADGSAWCVSLPGLRRLCALRGADVGFPADHYYLQPAASCRYVTTPAGGRRAAVRLWSAVTGAVCTPPLLAPTDGPALVCLLPPRQDEMLVLAGHYVLMPGASLRFSRGVRSAPVGEPPCSGPPPPRACPCAPQPRPACRARPADRVEALKVTCCPPERAPCPPCLKKPPLTCSSRKLSQGSNSLHESNPRKSCIASEKVDRCSETCGNQNDRVERRLAAEERVRREQYEREACERGRRSGPGPEPAAYCLGRERECARATDGRQYAVLCGREPAVAPCGPGRRAPPPQCVELIADDACKIRGAAHLDPCAHRRRTIMQIDRSRTASDEPPRSDMKGDNSSGVTVSKQPCDKKCDEKSCQIKRSKPPAAPPCKLPSVTETLRERGAGPCSDPASPPARSLHTSARSTRKNKTNAFKTSKKPFSTSKLISSSSPDMKIITINRATSPLVKQMSANSCGKTVKSGSWSSFEKLRKFCQGFGCGKKDDKKNNMSSGCKKPPPCGPPPDRAKSVPPNPCAPKPGKKQNTNPCASKKPPISPCEQKKQNPCGCGQKSPEQRKPASKPPPKSPSPCQPCRAK